MSIGAHTQKTRWFRARGARHSTVSRHRPRKNSGLPVRLSVRFQRRIPPALEPFHIPCTPTKRGFAHERASHTIPNVIAAFMGIGRRPWMHCGTGRSRAGWTADIGRALQPSACPRNRLPAVGPDHSPCIPACIWRTCTRNALRGREGGKRAAFFEVVAAARAGGDRRADIKAHFLLCRPFPFVHAVRFRFRSHHVPCDVLRGVETTWSFRPLPGHASGPLFQGLKARFRVFGGTKGVVPVSAQSMWASGPTLRRFPRPAASAGPAVCVGPRHSLHAAALAVRVPTVYSIHYLEKGENCPLGQISFGFQADFGFLTGTVRPVGELCCNHAVKHTLVRPALEHFPVFHV